METVCSVLGECAVIVCLGLLPTFVTDLDSWPRFAIQILYLPPCMLPTSAHLTLILLTSWCLTAVTERNFQPSSELYYTWCILGALITVLLLTWHQHPQFQLLWYLHTLPLPLKPLSQVSGVLGRDCGRGRPRYVDLFMQVSDNLCLSWQ